MVGEIYPPSLYWTLWSFMTNLTIREMLTTLVPPHSNHVCVERLIEWIFQEKYCKAIRGWMELSCLWEALKIFNCHGANANQQLWLFAIQKIPQTCKRYGKETWSWKIRDVWEGWKVNKKNTNWYIQPLSFYSKILLLLLLLRIED